MNSKKENEPESKSVLGTILLVLFLLPIGYYILKQILIIPFVIVDLLYSFSPFIFFGLIFYVFSKK